MEVGEEGAPCLMRSVSQPFFASCEYKEGDPLRALTTSISFGRFMVEPLDWEKWSSFSHNRTLEDVQKYSRPGAVAEKKAFFEAHYKKIAAKGAAISPKKENKAPNFSSETNVKTDVNSTRSNTHSAIDDTRGNDLSTLASNPVFSNTDECVSSSRQAEQETTSSDDVYSPSTGLVISEDINVDEYTLITSQVEQEKASTDDVCLPSTNLVLEKFGSVDDNMPIAGQVEQKNASTGNVLRKDHQLKVAAASDGDKISGRVKPKISSNKNGAHKRRSPQREPAPPIHSRKAARDVTDKKRSAPQSLHMSMNHPPVRNKNGTSKTISKPKDRLIQQALTRVLVNGVMKIFEVEPRPEIRRLKPKLDCSVIRSREVVKKSLSTNHTEASNACTKKPKSTTVPSSFSFRSEERAAKRKEFFQKLEEKGNTKEMEKISLRPRLKEKASKDNKKLRRSTGLEAKPSTSEMKAPNNIMHKVLLTQPCSPKLGRNPTTRLVKDTSCQPPWRSSSKPKNFIDINKKILSSSMASLPTKKMHHQP